MDKVQAHQVLEQRYALAARHYEDAQRAFKKAQHERNVTLQNLERLRVMLGKSIYDVPMPS